MSVIKSDSDKTNSSSVFFSLFRFQKWGSKWGSKNPKITWNPQGEFQEIVPNTSLKVLMGFHVNWTRAILLLFVLSAAAAAAAKSLQSCPTLCNPIDGLPPGSPIPGILQARTLGWVAISFSNAWKWKVKVKLLSCVRFLATPWTAAYQAALPMGFSRQEYWSGLSLPSVCLIYL